MKGQTEIGVVVGGALTKSLEVRLHPGAEAALGQYVMAPLDEERRRVVLGMVTDMLLRSAESGAISWPPPAGEDPASQLLREVLLDTGVYTAVEVSPHLEVDIHGGETSRARRLPRHFAPVAAADQATVDLAFATGERPAVHLGSPLGMEEVEVNVDIEKLFERSAGIFGKSGTGKTVIALQFLSAMVAHSARQQSNREKTVALIFDMHDDYGEWLKFEGGRRKSLKQMHATDVCLYTLEDTAANVDGRVTIGTRDIGPEDLEVLQAASELTSGAIEAAWALEARLGAGWIDAVLEDSPPAALTRGMEDEGEEPTWARVIARMDIHAGSWGNLRRRLRSIVRRDFVKSGSGQVGDTIDHIVRTLQGGKSVVVQFGRHGNDLASYMLVANMLSRRIWERYRAAKDNAGGEAGKEPNRLVIVIEEAHKFVDKSLTGQSIFGQIARELRKYNVTLLVIDQRPSQIDPEVLSQIGTKFCLQLDSEADVDALVGGVAGRAGLRQVIASLESQQQALVFGHALPMPVVVRPPELTPDFRPGASLRDRLGASAAAPEAPPSGNLLYGKRLVTTDL
jgi:DNA helicase HerA-like ATPase